MSREKNSSILKTTLFFFFIISGCCYGYCDQLCNCLVRFWCALAQTLTVIRKNVFVFSEVVTVMISWQQNFVSSYSVCNHTRDWQIGLPLHGRQILFSLVWLKTELHFTQSYYHYLSSRENNRTIIFSCNNEIIVSFSVSYLSFPIRCVWRRRTESPISRTTTNDQFKRACSRGILFRSWSHLLYFAVLHILAAEAWLEGQQKQGRYYDYSRKPGAWRGPHSMGLRALSLLHLIPYSPQLILLSLARNINLKSTYSFIFHLEATQLLPNKKIFWCSLVAWICIHETLDKVMFERHSYKGLLFKCTFWSKVCFWRTSLRGSWANFITLSLTMNAKIIKTELIKPYYHIN